MDIFLVSDTTDLTREKRKKEVVEWNTNLSRKNQEKQCMYEI